MTQAKAFAMTNDRETFLQGAMAFRNTRDLAKRYRNELVQAANARVRQPNAKVSFEAEVVVIWVQRHVDSTTEGFMDYMGDIGLQVVDVGERPGLPQHGRAEDNGQTLTSHDAVAPPISFTTSLTPGFNTHSQSSSKRTRAPRSPPSNPQPHEKHNTSMAQEHQSTPSANCTP